MERFIILDRIAKAIALVSQEPDIRVWLFESSWDAVDRSRIEVQRRGLEDRISVRHWGALRAARGWPALDDGRRPPGSLAA